MVAHMDEEFYYAGPAEPDAMAQRCEMINELARTADGVSCGTIKGLLVDALKAMVWSITPPRGQVVAFKPDFPTEKSVSE
jgi:hypothetical protein